VVWEVWKGSRAQAGTVPRSPGAGWRARGAAPAGHCVRFGRGGGGRGGCGVEAARARVQQARGGWDPPGVPCHGAPEGRVELLRAARVSLRRVGCG
jgi:hypothetical protein